MIAEYRTHGKPWSWLALVWLGIFLMLGALSLPARAAVGGFVVPAAPGTPGLEAAGRVRTALTTQGYVVTSVGLSDDAIMAGVIMRPVARAFDAAAWQQVQAGWQSLAETYPQATWLLSGYTAGERYLICFLVPARSSPAAGQMGVYDTLLGRWVQEKDFARKDFGTSAHSSGSLVPIPTVTVGAEAPPAKAVSEGFQDASTGPSFLPYLDHISDHIAMRVEDRRRWLEDPLSTSVVWCMVPAPGSAPVTVTVAPLRDLCTSVPHQEDRTTARWCRRMYPADSGTEDAGEDPAGDPPPVTQPLLVPRPIISKTNLLPEASALLLACPDPVARLGVDDDTTSLIPPYLLAWPTLRVRPPPRLAWRYLVFPLHITYPA